MQCGLAWVAVDADNAPIGYLVASEVDGNLHMDQVSVLPSHARHGIGRSLMRRSECEAMRRGLPAVTLTTFREVAWNAPYYQRCGFVVIGYFDQGVELRRIRQQEVACGLDRWPRVCMRKNLSVG